VAALSASAVKGLSEQESKRLLGLYGLRGVPEEVVRSPAAATTAAARLGYPVVLKAHGRGLRHKTELGGVRLDLSTPDAVEAAFIELVQSTGFPEALVARMIPAAPELLLGLSRDPDVGLLLVVGLGGTLAEVLDDVVLAVPPLWPGEAEELLASLRGRALLDGVRGTPPSDRPAVIRALEGLSQLACEAADLIETVDVNPIIAAPDGAWVVDALVIPRGAPPVPP
jgi:hypothetical protein